MVVMREVLFICTGNYYRSRLAEALFNHGAEERGLAWRAFSRGLATHLVDGAGDISLNTRFALLARGVPLRHTGARPMQLALRDLERAARVVALKEAEHRPLLRALFPAWEDRVEYWHVHDVDVGPPDVAVAEIERLTHGLLDGIAPDGPDTQARPRVI